MAQRVEAVENPRYGVSGLSTTSGTIVSTRTVMVPPTIQGTFKGMGDYSNGGNQYIQFQVADNECYMDNKCLYMICDLLVYGPNNSELNPLGPKYGNPIDLRFDQSSDALFSQLTIGSPQGLKIEEIQQYNMWANIIRLHTESAAHKEHDLLRYTEYSKDIGKEYGLQHLTDDAWRKPVQIPIGVKTRMAFRFDFADSLQNMEMFPLFLMRNGLQITIYLENAYKAMYCPSGFSNARDICLRSDISFRPYLFNKGVVKVSGGIQAVGITVNENTVKETQNIIPPYGTLSSAFSGEKIVASTASLLVASGEANAILAQCGAADFAHNRTRFFACPVTIKEFNQIVWSGFALIPSYLPNQLFLHDQYSELDGYTYAHCYTNLEAVVTVSKTNAQISSLIENARSLVKQLDHDGSEPFVRTNDATLTSISFQRYPSGTQHDLLIRDGIDMYAMWSLFSFNDMEQIPFARLDDIADVIECNNHHMYSGGEVIFHCADAVKLYTDGNANYVATDSSQVPVAPDYLETVFNVLDPSRNALSSVLSQWSLPESQRKFRYEISNPQLMLNLVKPSAEVAMRAQQDFTSPSGIAVKYKKVIYQKKSFNDQTSGLLQVTIPVSVRSLTGVIFVIQDPALDAVPNNVINNMLLANLSTFQNRRLTEQYIQVGGQQYPVYMYQMRPDGDKTQYWEAHVLELEKLFGVAGNASFNASLSRPMIKKTRNMLAGGYLGANNPIQLGNLGPSQRCTYTDSSGVVYGMNLAKDWVRTFTCGIDSSAVGNISLNLQFKDPNGSSNISTAFGASNNGGSNQSGSRAFSLHMFIVCDAVVTYQESANMVRS